MFLGGKLYFIGRAARAIDRGAEVCCLLFEFMHECTFSLAKRLFNDLIYVCIISIYSFLQVTVPFDSDYHLAKQKLICACWSENEDNYHSCPVFVMNCEIDQRQKLPVPENVSDFRD